MMQAKKKIGRHQKEVKKKIKKKRNLMIKKHKVLKKFAKISAMERKKSEKSKIKNSN